ncbi:hypothetical protein HCH_05769 [Hahella chejuensis KCTC 2396]|uniref:Uncharacterized protein n=1 Tax=Hahella chejuensis (strain KCTC 2396) TaxID=349521 RepID=Q2SAA4_HAHCH|nr:hypothetical protein [Hahella chejuensis]ABC32420.1 hypothetical protein HCH_05769 [Hahella chejuensis KCTC 2396]
MKFLFRLWNDCFNLESQVALWRSVEEAALRSGENNNLILMQTGI